MTLETKNLFVMDEEGKMSEGQSVKIKWAWLRVMYLYTVIGAGGSGFGMLFFPEKTQSAFGFPPQDPAVWGLYGSVALASGFLGILALRFPLKFSPLLLLQLVYKPVWIVFAALPAFFNGQFPFHIVMLTVIFATYIIGDLIAIPFSYLFAKK